MYIDVSCLSGRHALRRCASRAQDAAQVEFVSRSHAASIGRESSVAIAMRLLVMVQ
jgi:hypothetical protein